MSETTYPTQKDRDPERVVGLRQLEAAALAYAGSWNEADQSRLMEVANRFAAGTERLDDLLAAAKAGGAALGMDAADAWHATRGLPQREGAQERVEQAFEIARLLRNAGLPVSDLNRQTEPVIMARLLGDVLRLLREGKLVKREGG